MKIKNRNLLLISYDERALNLAERRLERKNKFTLIKLPLFNTADMSANKLIDEFIFFSNYYAIICILDLQAPEAGFKMLTYLSSISSKCVLNIENENIKKSIILFHRDIIMNIFPNLKSNKAIKKRENYSNFLRIKHPAEIDQIIEKTTAFISNKNNFINPRFLAIKILEKDYVFLERIKKIHKISIDQAEILSENFNSNQPIITIHNKCIELTAEYLLGKYYENCFKALF